MQTALQNIATFCADLQKRASAQLQYDLESNLPSGRRHHLSRVDAHTLENFHTLAAWWHCTLADAIARAASQAITQLHQNPPPQ